MLYRALVSSQLAVLPVFTSLIDDNGFVYKGWRDGNKSSSSRCRANVAACITFTLRGFKAFMKTPDLLSKPFNPTSATCTIN